MSALLTFLIMYGKKNYYIRYIQCMKINFQNCRTTIKQGVNNFRDMLFPRRVYYVKEKFSPRANLSGIAEDTFMLQGDRQVAHGIVMARNRSGRINYSLDSSKQTPLTYNHVLHEPKQRSAHITNLTNELERVCYNGKEFETLFEEQPHLSRTVGSLPQKWGRKIGSSKEKREQVDRLFTEFGRKFYSKVNNEFSTEEVSTKNLQEGLSKVLDSDVQISYIGKGSFGRAYKIDVDSQEYVLKVYYNGENPKDYDSNIYYSGNFHELSSAVWASKNDPNNYAMFYMGRFGEKGDGYMLTRYIPNVVEKNKIYNGMSDLKDENFVFSRYLHKLRCSDVSSSSSNRHDKKIIDFGHTFVSKAGQLDEKTFHLTKTLGRLIDENNSKELAKVVEKYEGTEEFEQAKSFLQYLINEYATLENSAVLKSKKDLLSSVGIDYVPDIRHVVPTMRFPINVKYDVRPNYDEKCYSNIFGIPYNAFEQLRQKYPDLLKTEA